MVVAVPVMEYLPKSEYFDELLRAGTFRPAKTRGARAHAPGVMNEIP